MLRASFSALSVIEAELLSTEVLRCTDFLLFCSCDLDLDPMTFVYELDPSSMEIHRVSRNELPTSRLSKVRLTDRQTRSNGEGQVPQNLE